MQDRSRGTYEIAGREIVAEGADLRVSVLTLAAGQEVPWHYHSEVTDGGPCKFLIVQGVGVYDFCPVG